MKVHNQGIEMLRVLSMYMVVLLHVLGQGGILRNAETGSVQYWLAWVIEILCYGAVNIFALISGYVSNNTTSIKLEKLLKFWLQVLFYTITIVVIFFIIHPETRTFATLLDAIFPITRKQYWYITAYFGLMLFIPLINAGLKQLGKKEVELMLILSFICMSVLPTAFTVDPYQLNSGFSMLWLIILYIVGSYIRQYEITIDRNWGLFVYVVLSLFTLASKFGFEKIGLYGDKYLKSTIFTNI